MLSGLHILVTRPDPAGSELCQLIEAKGGSTYFFPTIAFAPPPDLIACQRALAVIGEQDWLIFVSPQAVYHGVPVIRQHWLVLPPTVKLAAIGAGTQQALHQAGYQSVICPESAWNSEGLLALPDFDEVNGKKIMIIRGLAGRELIDKAFEHLGAQVTPLIVYQRTLPKVEANVPAELILAHKISVIVSSSGDGVKNLTILLAAKTANKLFSIPLIVMSDRINTLAEDLGFQTIWVASNASHLAILDLLAQKRNELCQIL
jgi:uroporphyrinogen-III synthase